MSSQPSFPDVEFVCGDGILVRGHAVLLSAASPELHRILTSDPEQLDMESSQHACFSDCQVTTDADRPSRSYRLHLRSEFLARAMLQLLHFLYTVSVVCRTLTATLYSQMYQAFYTDEIFSFLFREFWI